MRKRKRLSNAEKFYIRHNYKNKSIDELMSDLGNVDVAVVGKFVKQLIKEKKSVERKERIAAINKNHKEKGMFIMTEDLSGRVDDATK